MVLQDWWVAGVRWQIQVCTHDSTVVLNVYHIPRELVEHLGLAQFSMNRHSKHSCNAI